MDKVSKMLHSLLESNSVVKNQTDNIMERYNEITEMKNTKK